MYGNETQNNIAFGSDRCRSYVRTARKGSVLGGAAVALMLMASPAALAETCSTLASPVGNLSAITGSISSTAGNIASAITTAQSAFLLQSTAFVSSPGNAQPDQQGSGVWVRGVGGTVNVQNPSTSNATVTVGGALVTAGALTCDTAVRADFVGVQVGHDIASLNHDGWSIHFGTTAGYLESRGKTIGGNSLGGSFTNTTQSPFAGTYLVVSKGGFFADALLRGEYYEASFNSPTFGIQNQNLNARGITVAASAGYNWAIPNTKWFIEPSGGVIFSRTAIDTFQSGGIPGVGGGVPGQIVFNDIKSTIGRAGVRVGTSFAWQNWVWSPFAAASVWHEFGDAPTANYRSCCTVVGPAAAVITDAYTGTTVGTYGQYSLGIAGQLVNTGWVAFARVDYRKGQNIDGWDGTGGLRYHFTPDVAIPVIGKAPVLKAPPMMAGFNWTGVYVGGSVGADFAVSKMDFGAAGRTDPRGAGFIGGVQAGYNYQFAPQWVAGIEGSWDWTNLNGARQCTVLTDDQFAPHWNTTCQFSSDWLATLTGRIGYVWGRALWYVKAGGAAIQQTYTVTCNMVLSVQTNGPCPDAAGFSTLVASTSASTTRLGWTAGYGVEFAMTPKWTARAESSIYGFGNHNITLANGDVANTSMNVFSTKIGVNYKLF